MDLYRPVLFLVFGFVAVKCRDIRLFDNSRDISEGVLGLTPTSNLIEFLSVEKSSVDETRNRFKLRFTKNVQDLKFEVFDLDSPLPRSGSEGQEDGGVSTFTFTIGVHGVHEALCVVSTSDKRSSIMFVLDNSKGGAGRQDSIRIGEFAILPPGDIVYETDEDAQFKVFVTKGTETSDQRRHPLQVRFHVFNITSGEFKNVYDFDSVAVASRKELAGGVNETTITVKTSEHYITGMLNVVYSSRTEIGALVTQVIVSRLIVLRPSVQSNAYPDGEIGFVKKRSSETC
ncbi:hypothetical protein EGW08_005821, partial [Elysia chlorotica]